MAKLAPATARVLDPGATAVALGDVLHEGEADAAAAEGGPAPSRGRPANEALEDALAVLGGTPGPRSMTRRPRRAVDRRSRSRRAP